MEDQLEEEGGGEGEGEGEGGVPVVSSSQGVWQRENLGVYRREDGKQKEKLLRYRPNDTVVRNTVLNDCLL